MIGKQKTLVTACASVLAMGLSAASSAEVKSLTSNELTETYIKDSTIIVTPKKQLKQDDSKKKKITTLTISPADTEQIQVDTLSDLDKWQVDNSAATADQVALTEQFMREAAIREADSNISQVSIDAFSQPVELVLPNDPRYEVPVGDFDMKYAGDQLGLSRTGNKLTFSFGNLPGVDPVNLPNGASGGGVDIQPREGGGFDITFDVPQ